MAFDTKTWLLIGGAAAVGVFLATRESTKTEEQKNVTPPAPPGPTVRTYKIRGVGNDGSARNFTIAWNPTVLGDETKIAAKIAELYALNPKASTAWANGLVLTIPPLWPAAPKEFQGATEVSGARDLIEENARVLGQIAGASGLGNATNVTSFRR